MRDTTEQEMNEVLTQWEPKVNSFLRNTTIRGLDREDIAQELRIAIVKAWRGFDPDRGIKFHTYLHTAMLHTVWGLMGKEKKRVNTSSLDELMLATDRHGSEVMSGKYAGTLEDDSQEDIFNAVDLASFVGQLDLSEDEITFLEMRIRGFKMKDITQHLGIPAAKVRDRIRKRTKSEHGEIIIRSGD